LIGGNDHLKNNHKFNAERRLEEQRDSSRGMQESIEMENQVRKSKIHFNIACCIYKAIVVPFTDMRLPRSA